MNLTMKKYILFILAGFLYVACEDVVTIDLHDVDLDSYVVQANLTTIDEPVVYFGKPLPITVDTLYNGISDAIITISDDASPSNTVTLVENAKYNGFYGVPENEDYFGEIGRSYTINILTTEGTNITATETLARVEPIDSIEVKPSMRGAELFLGIFTYGQETPGLGNYYKWDIYINDTALSSNENLMFVDDALVDGNYVPGLEIFTDFHDPDKEDERMLQYLDTIFVRQYSITESAYDYYYFMINQLSSGSMFSVPPANLPSNFTADDGKSVNGIFLVQDVSISNTVVVDSLIESSLRKL